MSFSQTVREELLLRRGRRKNCREAEAAALWLFGGKGLSKDELTGKYVYTDLRRSGGSGSGTIFKTLDIDRIPGRSASFESQEEKRAYLRGAFIAAGTISDPMREYHFEISAPDSKSAAFVTELLAQFGVRARLNTSRRRNVVYVKGADEISLILNIMEANSSMMEFENIRIERELRGDVNRRVNCDTANINKSVTAGFRQAADIELIRDALGFESLDEPLRQMCEARLENPDASIAEIGELMRPPIGKSGANHRLRKLSAIAEEIREKQKRG